MGMAHGPSDDRAAAGGDEHYLCTGECAGCGVSLLWRAAAESSDVQGICPSRCVHADCHGTAGRGVFVDLVPREWNGVSVQSVPMAGVSLDRAEHPAADF